MKLDAQTLIIMWSLALVTQVIALFVQYKIGNRTYRGVEWWLLGTSVTALGVILMPLVTVESLVALAMIANPLVVLGEIFLYIAIIRFLDKKEKRWMLISIYVGFIIVYYYYIFFSNDISSRTVAINVTLAVISFLAAHKLFSEKDKFISSSAKFTATIFLLYGTFSTVRFIWVSSGPPVQTYFDSALILNLGIIAPTVASILWTFGFMLMSNQRLNMENLLEKEKMKRVFNTSPDAALITRWSDGIFVDVNVGFTTLFGYSCDELLGDTAVKVNIWRTIEERQLFIDELNAQGICENMEFVFQRKDRSQFFGIISARIIEIQDIPHIVSVVRDITERKQAEEALLESEEQYRSILNASPDNITITDLEGHILMISPAAKKMFGFEQNYDQFAGMKLLDFIVPEDVERAKSNLRLMYQGGFHKPNEYRGMRRDKSIFDIEVNSDFVRNVNGQPIRMVFIIRDITERKVTEQHIQELIQQLEIEKNTAQRNSITDSLTGLSNRRYFDMVLEREYYRLKRSGATLSLIMLDVDHFKKFNDTYGHLVGDDCLQRIGTMLKTIVGRAPDIVARYGGEEFAVILPETESSGAGALAERIRKGVEGLAIAHSTSGTAEYVSVSLGVVSVYTASFISPKQIVALADEALYCAKNKGRNQIEVVNYCDNHGSQQR